MSPDEPRSTGVGPRFPSWFVLGVGASLGSHLLAGAANRLTIDLMRSSSPVASDVRAMELELIPSYSLVSYVLVTTILVAYLWPLVTYFRQGLPRRYEWFHVPARHSSKRGCHRESWPAVGGALDRWVVCSRVRADLAAATQETATRSRRGLK